MAAGFVSGVGVVSAASSELKLDQRAATLVELRGMAPRLTEQNARLQVAGLLESIEADIAETRRVLGIEHLRSVRAR